MEVLLAGLALNLHGSVVNGLTYLRTAFACFFFNFMLKTPPKFNLPFFFNSAAANSKSLVSTVRTFTGLSCIDSAICAYPWLVVRPDAPVFFAARFMAGAMVSMNQGIKKCDWYIYLNFFIGWTLEVLLAGSALNRKAPW